MKAAFALCLLMLWNCAAHADGGRLRFSKAAGPFTVTLFTTPEPLTPGPADFSVMVQDGATGKIISDAEIRLHLTGPDGRVVEAIAVRGLATNRLLEAADAELSAAGEWHVKIEIRQGTRSAVCETDVAVEAGSRKATLVWTFALLPVVAVGLFALQQRQKTRVRARSLAARSRG